MEDITIRIQNAPHLAQTPLTQFDIEEILRLLGFNETAISTAAIAVSQNKATVQWPEAQTPMAA